MSLNAGAQTEQPQFIRIGVLAFDENNKNISRWQPTIDYLNNQLPQYQFVLVSGDIKSIDQLVASDTLDFAITNSVRFNLFQNNHEAVRVLSLKPLHGDPQFAIGSAVVARSDMPPIQNWNEIKNKKIIATSPHAFGGFQIIQREWLEEGIDPLRDFTQLQFMNIPQEELLTELKDNKADIAILPTCVLEDAISSGRFPIDMFKVLHLNDQSHLPCQSSSPLYPHWVLSRMRHMDESIARDIAQSLLAMTPDDEAAILGRYQGWTVPISDHKVLELMRTLDILESKRSISAILWEKYRGWVLIILGLGLLMLSYHMRVKYLVRLRTKQLHQAMILNEEASEKFRQQQELFYSAQRILLSGEMAAGLAHELNQPLMAINSYVVGSRMRLQQQPLDIQAVDKALENAVQQILNAKDIIIRTKKFIKSYPEKHTLIQLKNVLENALALFEHEFKRQSIQVILPQQCHEQIRADKVLIQQVIVNLILNAIDAIQAHDPPIQNSCIELILKTDAKNVTLMIRDNGIGMTEIQREYLFVPFNTSKKNGIGLGMIISKRIIEAHGGKIWSESTLSGACICFSLPLEQESSSHE